MGDRALHSTLLLAQPAESGLRARADHRPAWVPGLVLLVAFGTATVWAWTRMARWGWFAFVGTWFFMLLAPSSSVVPIVTEIAAERRIYLALVSVIIAHGRWRGPALAAPIAQPNGAARPFGRLEGRRGIGVGVMSCGGDLRPRTDLS